MAAVNPTHTAPTLKVGDVAIWESNAIMRFLCNNFPAAAKFYPADDPFKRAKLDIALDWRQTGYYQQIPALGYHIFGYPSPDEQVQESFKKLLGHLELLTGTFLKDTPFVYSDTVTIADLAIVPPLGFVMSRPKFYEKIPQAVKDYRARVEAACPEIVEVMAPLVGMATGATGAATELAPEE